MNTSFTTKTLAGVPSSHKSGIVAAFYLLTFLAGGFFLFVGGRLGFVVDLSAATFYIAVTVLFYSLSKGA